MNTILRFRDHAQVTVPTGEDIRRKTSALRAIGWKVSTSSMGNQVTEYGLMKMTLVNIYCTERQPDICDLPATWDSIGKEACDRAIFEVVVGNIGTVYSGNNYMQAECCYFRYLKQSRKGEGRAAGESVVLFHHGEIKREHAGTVQS